MSILTGERPGYVHEAGESEVLGRNQMAVSQQCTAALQLESKPSAAGHGRKVAWSKT